MNHSQEIKNIIFAENTASTTRLPKSKLISQYADSGMDPITFAVYHNWQSDDKKVYQISSILAIGLAKIEKFRIYPKRLHDLKYKSFYLSLSGIDAFTNVNGVIVSIRLFDNEVWILYSVIRSGIEHIPGQIYLDHSHIKQSQDGLPYYDIHSKITYHEGVDPMMLAQLIILPILSYKYPLI